jgi:hypothetical protein
MLHKYILLLQFFLVFISSNAQNLSVQMKINVINQKEIINQIDTSSKPILISYWIPSCSEAKNIYDEMKSTCIHYNNEYKYFFLALTNKKELVSNIIDSLDDCFKFYILDSNLSSNILERRLILNNVLQNKYKLKTNDFVTILIKNREMVFLSKSSRINLKKLKQATQ